MKKTTEEKAASKRRGNSQHNTGHTYLIEGDYCTSEQIAERLGVVQSTALTRLRAAQKLPGPVTRVKRGETSQ